VRLLLDAHFSGPRVAVPLRERGYDVRSVDEERALDAARDEHLLALATRESRVLVTCDVSDFSGITRRWAEAQRPHGGCIMLVGIDHSEFGVIIGVVDRRLAGRPSQATWVDRTELVGRGG